MNPAAAIMLTAAATTLAALITWALCTLADDPPQHCQGCRCAHTSPARLYDYEQDPAYPTAS